MLLIILISVLVIGVLIAKTKLKKQPKKFEPSLNYSHDELAPEATPEPSIIEAIAAPKVEKKAKKKPTTTNKPVVKMDAKKKPTTKSNKK